VAFPGRHAAPAKPSCISAPRSRANRANPVPKGRPCARPLGQEPLHIDIHASGDEPHASAGRRILLAVRKQRVDAEASRLVALGATLVAVLSTDGLDHYAIAMRDPEGNEFDIN
jgi:hypothetical protein